MTDTFSGGSGGGYPGGATPSGYSPHEDGSGRFMYDTAGELHMNPNYRDWLAANDQRIDWGGVRNDLVGVMGSSYGWIAVGQVRQLIGWSFGALSEYFRNSRPPNAEGETPDDNE